MTDIFWMAICLAGLWGLGAAIALLIVGPRLVSMPIRGVGCLVARAELIGLGWVLGIAATSYLQFVWSLAGGKLGRDCSLTLCLSGIALGPLAIWRSRVAAAKSTPVDQTSKGRTESSGLARLCAIFVLGLWANATVQVLLSPQKLWDERAFYGLKAIVLFEDHSIDSPDLANADFVQGHPRYPLLVPLAEQHVYAMLGRVDDRLSKLLFPLMYAGLVFTLAGVLMRHMESGKAWLGALLLATVPVLMPDDYGFLSGQADAPVACFEGVTLLYLWDLLASRRSGLNTSRSLILAGFCGAMVAFTKDEGIAFGAIRSIAFVGAAAVPLLTRSRTSSTVQTRMTGLQFLLAIVALALIPAVIQAPWFLHRRHLPLTGEMNYFGRLSLVSVWNGLPTLKWSVPHLLERMFLEATTWGVQWWGVAITLVLFPRRVLRPAQLFVLLTLLGDIAALLLAGMIAPVTLEEHIGGSSHRYLMQLAPGAVVFLMGQLMSPADEPSR